MHTKSARKLGFALATLLIPFLAACGGNDDDSSPSGPTSVPVVGSATRPVLTAAQAANYTYAKVLTKTGTAGSETDDPWDPLADAFMAGTQTVTANYTADAALAANTAKSFKTVQAAINQAVVDATASGSTNRIYIEVKPGTYNELVYVPALAAPITLYSNNADATKTVITAAIDAGMPGNEYVTKFGTAYASVDATIAAMYAVQSAKGTGTIGTSGSAMAWTKNNGFQAKNLTFNNSYNEDRGTCGGTKNAAGQCSTGNHQAVAFLADNADRVQIENCRFISNQDTLYFKSSAAGKTVRSFYNKAYVEGDIDFIFGRATGYFRKATVKSLGARTGNLAYATAPSTNYNTSYGIVFDDSDFISDGAAPGSTYLARQWFESGRCTPYGANVGAAATNCLIDTTNTTDSATLIKQTTLETVGKTIILNSRIGAHINPTTPWSDWNTDVAGATNYRPVQYSSDNFYNNLVAIGKNTPNYVKKVPADAFLAEYNTVSN